MFEGVDSTGYMSKDNREANASKVSLQDRLQNMAGQPLPLEETFTILTQLGQALCYAHQCNVTHGNLKPATILFNEKGEVLLAEFFLYALAKQPDNGTVPEASQYRAPELLPGQSSKQGDQYALGYIAYEMLTGNKPFLIASISRPDTFYRMKKPIPPKHFNPALSPLIEEAILKAIAKEPAQRHGDISCFLATLGISTDIAKQATGMEAALVPLVSGTPAQADAHQAATWYAIEEGETPPTLDISTPTQMVHLAQTSVPAEAEAFSPDYYPFAHNLLADAMATNPEAGMPTSAYTRPLSTNSANPLLKWRWIGTMITCLIVVCIMAISLFALSTSHSMQANKTIPAIDTRTDLSSPTPITLSTPTPNATPTPEQRPISVPSPTVGPTATPTPNPHGHHH